MRVKVIVIVGPTAVGKTALAAKLAGRINGEIISCDSMQIYKGMEVLSQAPSTELRKQIPHHLVGMLSPRQEYSAAIFRKMAEKLVGSILRRKKIPVIVGGSGLYVKALIDGLFPSPEADLKFRKKMSRFAVKYGPARLHAKLTKIDPSAAGNIHPNDARRIIRALEVYHSTGKTMTELKHATKGLAGKYDIKIFGLTMPREKIYSNIDKRVDTMFEAGALKEAKKLIDKRLSKTAAAALGIKEIAGYLKGEYALDEAKELLKRNTRRFAKRQLTWFRADKRIKWFNTARINNADIVKRIAKEAK